jgi:cobalt/nickel transport system ATP-binding protein
VILLDEPTAALDPRTKWVLVNLIRRLSDAGRTIVTSTHELDVVPYVADRAVVLGENRRVVADGPVSQVLNDRALLISANLIHEHLHGHGGVFHSHEHEHADEHDHQHGELGHQD